MSATEKKVRPRLQSRPEAGPVELKGLQPRHRVAWSLRMTSMWRLALGQGTWRHRRLSALGVSDLKSPFDR